MVTVGILPVLQGQEDKQNKIPSLLIQTIKEQVAKSKNVDVC